MKSLKKLKDDLDRMHRALVRDQLKASDLISKLNDANSSHSDRARFQNDLSITSANIRSIKLEISELSGVILGDWKPRKEKD
jgi:predicted GTPase